MVSVLRILSAARSGWLAIVLAALAMTIVTALGRAQIEALTLEEMVERTDNAVLGTIVDRAVFRVDHPVDGPELYFTVLTLEGRSLVNGNPIVVDVTYHGGFVDEENGVYNSEAPAAHEVRIGNRVVVFYEWVENMGGEVAGNALYTSHGGLYRAARTRSGTVVLGRGRGYALPTNRTLADLEAEIVSIAGGL